MRIPALIFSIMLFFWSHAASAAPQWKVSEVAGLVRLQHADNVQPATRGAALSPGEAVLTGRDGRAVLTRGEEFVIVSPNSRLRLPAAPESRGIVQMIQDFGQAIYKIQKKATPHFGVKTPFLAAVVKGTTFKVSADDRGASVEVIEGRVEVGTSDGRERHMVTPGMLAAVAAATPGAMTVAAAPADRTRSAEPGERDPVLDGEAVAPSGGGSGTSELATSHALAPSPRSEFPVFAALPAAAQRVVVRLPAAPNVRPLPAPTPVSAPVEVPGPAQPPAATPVEVAPPPATPAPPKAGPSDDDEFDYDDGDDDGFGKGKDKDKDKGRGKNKDGSNPKRGKAVLAVPVVPPAPRPAPDIAPLPSPKPPSAPSPRAMPELLRHRPHE